MQVNPVVRGLPAIEKRALMVAKVRLKEASAKRRRRKRDAEDEARMLYNDFLGDRVTVVCSHVVEVDACDADDEECKSLWDEISTQSAADSLFKHCAKAPDMYVRTGLNVREWID